MTVVKIPPRRESSIGAAFVKEMKKRHPTWRVIKLKGDGRRDLLDYMVLGENELQVCFVEMKQPGKRPTKRQDMEIVDLVARGFFTHWFNHQLAALTWVEFCFELKSKK